MTEKMTYAMPHELQGVTILIVELHGGRIWVESEDSGKGSVFCFTLPKAGLSVPIQNLQKEISQ